MNSRNNFHSLFFALLLCCLFHPADISAQFYSLRNLLNLVGLSTGNLNLEGSIALSTRWSAHLPLQYNPFELWDNAKLKNSPWPPASATGCARPTGGAASSASTGSSPTSMPGGFGHRYRYQGTAWGGGSPRAGTPALAALEHRVRAGRRHRMGRLGALPVAHCGRRQGQRRAACCPRARPSTLSTCSDTLFLHDLHEPPNKDMIKNLTMNKYLKSPITAAALCTGMLLAVSCSTPREPEDHAPVHAVRAPTSSSWGEGGESPRHAGRAVGIHHRLRHLNAAPPAEAADSVDDVWRTVHLDNVSIVAARTVIKQVTMRQGSVRLSSTSMSPPCSSTAAESQISPPCSTPPTASARPCCPWCWPGRTSSACRRPTTRPTTFSSRASSTPRPTTASTSTVRASAATSPAGSASSTTSTAGMRPPDGLRALEAARPRPPELLNMRMRANCTECATA